MFPVADGTERWIRSGLVLGLLLFVVCGLVAAPVSSGTPLAAAEGSADGVPNAGTNDSARSESGFTIDSALEDDTDSETVEVIVRLSEAETASAETPERAEAHLKHHAKRTQGEVLSYARSTDGITVRNRFWVTNAVLLAVDTSRVDLESFGQFDGVSTLHTNFEVELDSAAATGASVTGATGGATSTTTSDGTSPTADSPSSTASDTTYGLDQIKAPAVWNEYDTNGSGAKVAVLDTGVDVNHSDIDLYTADPSEPTYPGGWAEFDEDGNVVDGSTPQDFGDHGTHVSGTVAGGDASGTHIGVAPGVDLIHGAVLTDCEYGCSGTYAQVLEGMQWAIDQDADVVSMSLGVRDYEERFIDPVRNAQSSGTVVVSSSGNSGDGTSGSPGNVYETFAIGASTESEEITDFSSGETVVTDDNWSSPPADWPDSYIVPNVAAPGSSVASAKPGGGYQYKSGTSMAAPHVSGSVALLRSINENLRPAEIATALEETAWKPDGVDPDRDTRYGHGIVDVKAAADATSLVTITGTVTDRAGEPIDNATVTVDDGRWNATTDGSGQYELRVVPGDRTLAVNATGHHPHAETLELSAGDTVTRDVTLDFVTKPVGEDLPEPIEANGSVTTTFDVTDLEALTVTPTENATLQPGTLEFSVNGTRFEPNETVAFDPAVTDGQFNVTTSLAADLNGTLELDYEFARGNETQTVRTGPARVVPEIYDVGVIAGPDDAAGEALRTDLADGLPIAYRSSHVNTTAAVTAAQSEEYDVFVALEMPATDATLANPTATFVDATTANDTGVLYLGDGVDDDALVRLAANTSEIDRLEAPTHDGAAEVIVDEEHPLFTGVGTERDAVTLLENASNRTWFDAPGSRTFASATDDGALADGAAVSFDRPDEQILLGATPKAGPLTADGRAVVTNAVEYLGAGRFHVSEDFEAYGVSNGSAETTTVAVPEPGNVTVDLAAETTVDPANVTLSVNGTEIAPGGSIPVDEETVARGLAVDVTVTDGVDGETVSLAATFENESVTTSAIRFEVEPPARYAGTVAVNGEPARDDLAVRATYDGTVVAETTTAGGRFGVPAADGGGGLLEVNASAVPENATLNVSLGNAATNASPTWKTGDERRTDLVVSYDDPFERTTAGAPRWTAAGDEIGISLGFEGETAQYFTDRAWLEAYDTDPANRWNASHTYGPGDEGIVTAGARLTDLAGETRTVTARVLVVDGGIASITGTIDNPATGSGTLTERTESSPNGSVVVTPAHGNWTDERPVENGAFEAASEANVSTHVAFVEGPGEYPIYQTILDREFGDDETVAVELDRSHELTVEVTNESGGGVANASVSVTAINASETDTAVATREMTTDESGLWTGPNGDSLGASVNGTVTIAVTPPDDGSFVDETVVRTLTVNEPTTVSVELAERSEGGGGGGGGYGGGGSANRAIRFTSTTLADGSALLAVTGSRARLRAETPLTGVGADGVSFERVEIVPATSRTSYAFTLRPGQRGTAFHHDGAVAYADFEHDGIASTIGSTTLEFAVDDERLPAGTVPEDIVLSEYRDGEWHAVETTYDAETETHAATVSGLPTVAVGIEGATPDIEVVDSRIEPTEISAGESVRIEATVENAGDVAGNDEFTFAADGEPLTTERVDLAPGERQTITVEATLESAATITVGASTVGGVAVTDEPPSGDSSSRFDSVPGFGGFAAIVAGAVFLLVGTRCRPFDR